MPSIGIPSVRLWATVGVRSRVRATVRAGFLYIRVKAGFYKTYWVGVVVGCDVGVAVVGSLPQHGRRARSDGIQRGRK